MKRIVVPRQWPEEHTCQMAFVAEAPSDDEEMIGRPLVGRSGKMFNKLLRKVGIERAKCLVTNVFDFKLPDDNINNLCVVQKEADEVPEFPQTLVPVDRGAYVPAKLAVPQLERLMSELSQVKPNIIVALGGTAAWALLGVSPYGRMKKIRGPLHAGLAGKTIVTYHPAYLLHNYGDMPIVLADLHKALRESTTPELHHPNIEIIVPTRPEQVEEFLASLGELTAVDIETLKGTIDNIGFADCFERAMSVPIYRPDDDSNYWKSDEDEARVLIAIAKFLNNPHKKKLFQNGSYDVQWLFEKWGIAVRRWTDDTRLLHHSLWPEMRKDLGTIASLHLDMPAWKMAGAGRVSTKKED